MKNWQQIKTSLFQPFLFPNRKTASASAFIYILWSAVTWVLLGSGGVMKLPCADNKLIVILTLNYCMDDNIKVLEYPKL